MDWGDHLSRGRLTLLSLLPTASHWFPAPQPPAAVRVPDSRRVAREPPASATARREEPGAAVGRRDLTPAVPVARELPADTQPPTDKQDLFLPGRILHGEDPSLKYAQGLARPAGHCHRARGTSDSVVPTWLGSNTKPAGRCQVRAGMRLAAGGLSGVSPAVLPAFWAPGPSADLG